MVFCAAEMPTILCSSTSAAAGPPPLPLSPWHAAHFSAKITAPCAGVPLPFGNPVPSGRMLMSQLAMAASSIGLPRLGVSAMEAPAIIASNSDAAASSGRSGVNMLDLPVAADAPAGDRIVVLIGEAQDRRRFRQFAAGGHEFGAGRLHIAGFIPCPALQRGGAAVPAPRQAETGERLAQHRLLKRRLRPALAAVGGAHDLVDPAGAGIGDAGNLVETGTPEHQAVRRAGDEGFDLLQEIEPVGFAVGQDLRVGARLVHAQRGLVDELDAAQELDVHVAL